jgi:hypothetical protein
LQRSLFQINITEIIVHEADEPNAFVNFFNAERLPREDGSDIDLLAVHAEATTLWARRLSEIGFRASVLIPGPKQKAT